MKKKDLIERLEALGAEEGRHGGNHDIWRDKKGQMLVIPRHKEIDEDLASRTLIKQAKLAAQ